MHFIQKVLGGQVFTAMGLGIVEITPGHTGAISDQLTWFSHRDLGLSVFDINQLDATIIGFRPLATLVIQYFSEETLHLLNMLSELSFPGERVLLL